MEKQYFGALGTFQLRNGYAKRKGHSHLTRNSVPVESEDLMTFRNPANVAEMYNHCSTNSHIWVRTAQGTAKTVKVNGAVRTWKRDPNRIEVPCKYGLYEYFTLQAQDISDVLIPVEEK
jgi:hypothetical protein